MSTGRGTGLPSWPCLCITVLGHWGPSLFSSLPGEELVLSTSPSPGAAVLLGQGQEAMSTATALVSHPAGTPETGGGASRKAGGE